MKKPLGWGVKYLYIFTAKYSCPWFNFSQITITWITENQRSPPFLFSLGYSSVNSAGFTTAVQGADSRIIRNIGAVLTGRISIVYSEWYTSIHYKQWKLILGNFINLLLFLETTVLSYMLMDHCCLQLVRKLPFECRLYLYSVPVCVVVFTVLFILKSVTGYPFMYNLHCLIKKDTAILCVYKTHPHLFHIYKNK